jgi:tetratricopeptide (TPR) repeat protein
MGTTTAEFETKLQGAERGGFGAKRELLKHIRQHKTRRSDVVVEHGQVLLRSPGSLGDELWTLYEQVCVAAIDTHEYDAAEACLEKLQGRFKSSRRVRRLEGLLAEAQKKWGRAEQVYSDILDDDPSNAVARKRQACVARAQGDVPGAIKLINAYLEDQCGDQSAWLELASLYTELHRYKQALFCLEELISINPNNYQNHIRYAELLFTEGVANKSSELLIRSRKYFAQALDLRIVNNMRALYGLCNAAQAVHGCKDVDAEAMVSNDDVYAWGVEALTVACKCHRPASALPVLPMFVS